MWVIPVIVGVTMFLAHVAPFPFLLDWGSGGVAMWEGPPIDADAPGGPVVYLTFDDGPNPEATPALLDVLARHRVLATFFIIDRHLTEETAPIVRRAAMEGHGIALHAHSRAMAHMSPEEVEATLAIAEERLMHLAGVNACPAFRPHAGARSANMVTALRRTGRRLVGWGMFLWDFDWGRRKRASRLVPRIAERASPGSIIVLHDGHHEQTRPDRRYVVETVDQLIPKLREKGLSFDTICDAIADAER